MARPEFVKSALKVRLVRKFGGTAVMVRTTTVLYTIEAIRADVRRLIEREQVTRHQPICALFQYIPTSDWDDFERELEFNEYLLRDRIGDLIPQERWKND
jgi:hypothetical protein